MRKIINTNVVKMPTKPVSTRTQVAFVLNTWDSEWRGIQIMTFEEFSEYQDKDGRMMLKTEYGEIDVADHTILNGTQEDTLDEYEIRRFLEESAPSFK